MYHTYDDLSGRFSPHTGWAPTYHAVAPLHSTPVSTHFPNRVHQLYGGTSAKPVACPRSPTVPTSAASSALTPCITVEESEVHPMALEKAPPSPPSVESMESAVKVFLEGKKPTTSLEFNGLSWAQFQEFRDSVKITLPGWNKLK